MAQLNMNDGTLDGKQVIPAELIAQGTHRIYEDRADEPPFTGDGEYGLGWQIGKYRNEKVIYHHGGFAGYRSHVSFMPEKKIGVGVLVNSRQRRTAVRADMIATTRTIGGSNIENLEADYAKQLQDLFD